MFGRSEVSSLWSFGCSASHTVIPGFQRLHGRIPWTSICLDNDAHIVPKSNLQKYTLQDPSQMSQKAIMHFLELWKKHQELGKKWPLKFLKPTCLALEENVDHAAEDREPNGHHGTGDRQDEAMEHEDYDGHDHKGT